MSDPLSAPQVEDGFVAYYTEKLWAMIPEVYRHEDGLSTPPGALRALVTTWAKQAAVLRRSQDRLWEDLFITLCSDWAIPYIGDLVATRLLSAQNRRGQRVDVAKTIYYRRRAGTVRVLEELIADITGWEGVVVEGFKTLARSFHNLDQAPMPRGRLTLTPPSGTAEMRRADSAELAGGPFSEFFRTPDVRRTVPYGISKLAIHLYRLGTIKLHGVDPRPHGAPVGTAYTFDPSGRDVPLFAPRSRPQQWDRWRSAREYELPAPISCRLLADAHYRLKVEDVARLEADPVVNLTANAAGDLRTLAGILFKREADLKNRLAMLPNSVELLGAVVYPAILKIAALEECGKEALLPAAITITVDNVVLPNEALTAGSLSTWQSSPLNKRAVIDPERGRLLIYPPAPANIAVDYHVGAFMPVGAGGQARSPLPAPDNHLDGGGAKLNALQSEGNVCIEDSRSYRPVSSINDITNLTLFAADGQRPYLRLTSAWTLTSQPPIVPNEPDALLTLDGLWIGANATARSVILVGDYERVLLRYCTFDPGGLDSDGAEVPPVRLVIRGFVENLIIDHCVMGAIRLDGTGAVERLTIRDSILHSTRAGVNVLEIGRGLVDMARCTVSGTVDILRLYATDCLIAGVVDVSDTHDGCFRFSAAVAGSRLPHPYESYMLEPGQAKSLFVSDEYGKPGYFLLRQGTTDAVGRGGENGAEMGVYNRVGAPFKRDGLNAKLAEFMPFGLAPVVIVQA